MNRPSGLFIAVLALALAGCGPPEPPAPAEPTEAERATAQHLGFFGEAARDPAIAWRPSGLGIKLVVPGEGVEIGRAHV